MIPGAITLFVVAIVLVIIGISFVYDISKGVGPGAEGATVDSRGNRTYTFLRVEGPAVAWIVTILTFVLAAGAAVGGVVLLVTN